MECTPLVNGAGRSRVADAGAAGEHVGERLADGSLELYEMDGVVLKPPIEERGGGQQAGKGRDQLAAPVGGSKRAEDAGTCLALESELGEKPLLAVARTVSVSLPEAVIELRNGGALLGESTFEGGAGLEEFEVSEVSKDRAGAPAAARRCLVELCVGGFSDEVGE